MRHFRTIIGATAALAVIATAAAAVQDFSVRYTPKVDDSTKYKANGELAVMGMTVKISFNVTEKVTKVTDKDYTLEILQNNFKVDLGGQEMEVPESKVTTTYLLDGSFVKSAGAEEMGDASLANRAQVIGAIYRTDKKLKVGDEYSNTVKADKERGTMAVEGKYKVEAAEDVMGMKTLKISYEVKETEGDVPGSAKGHVWIDTASGKMVKQVGEWKDMPNPAAPEPVSGKVTIELVK